MTFDIGGSGQNTASVVVASDDIAYIVIAPESISDDTVIATSDGTASNGITSASDGDRLVFDDTIYVKKGKI